MEEKRIHLEGCPHKLVDGWIERGNKEEDVLFKFVSYWIALNQMYNYRGDENDSEASKIKAFGRKHDRIIIYALDFQAEYMKIFKERPILGWFDRADRYDWREGEDFVAERMMQKFSYLQNRPRFESNIRDAAKYYVRICDSNCRSKNKSEALLMSIYRIRCNLFHGNKDPDSERNYRLIESSARILENVLPLLRDEIYC